jgi:hypothetical protein
VGTRAPTQADIEISLNGGPAERVVSRIPVGRQDQQDIWASPVLPFGTHTLRITNVDEHNGWMTIDAFRVIVNVPGFHDLNGDGMVNILDLNLVLKNLGRGKSFAHLDNVLENWGRNFNN